jgi:hypothetical protein
MKKIAVEWPCEPKPAPVKVWVNASASELLKTIRSICDRESRYSRLLDEIQKLNMEQLRQWEKFPIRILRIM